MEGNKELVNIKVEIESDGFNRLVKEGKLVAFLDTLPVMLAGAVKAKLVDMIAAGTVGGGASITFMEDDYWPIPWPGPGPWPGPWADVGNPAITMLTRMKR